MTTSRFIRQGHRWVAGSFLTVVALYVAAMALGGPPSWFVYVPLLPLLLLALSGSYLLWPRRRSRSGDAAG